MRQHDPDAQSDAQSSFCNTSEPIQSPREVRSPMWWSCEGVYRAVRDHPIRDVFGPKRARNHARWGCSEPYSDGETTRHPCLRFLIHLTVVSRPIESDFLHHSMRKLCTRLLVLSQSPPFSRILPHSTPTISPNLHILIPPILHRSSRSNGSPT